MNVDSASDDSEKKARGVRRESGAVGWGVLWLIGVPVPILVLIWLFGGLN